MPKANKRAESEEKRRAREERRKVHADAQAMARKRREFAAAGVEYDPRLASGQREMHVSNVREISAKRASLVDPGSLIKRQSERTEPRIRAIAMFDELCHRAYAGLLPEPKFERGVDVSHSPAAVPEDRAGALGEMQRLAGFIGNEAQAILLLRVFQRQSFAWMAEQGIGEERSISALFLAGTDAVARFYGFCGPSRASELREHALRHV